MKKIFLLIPLSLASIIAMIFCSFESGNFTIFTSQNGKTKFISDAPLELIKAESNKLGSVIDIAKRTFAFTITMETFEGFNSPLQREHFLENYLEAEKFKAATFKGKIVEEVDLSVEGTYNVRVKGMINIHGVEKEKIIKAKIIVKSNEIDIESNFQVPLEEHNIKIPKLVNQKIAALIIVEVKAILLPKK